jgi:membrane-associated phospholipid phosphatase
MSDKPPVIDLRHPGPGEAILPLPRPVSRARWAWRIAVWAGLITLVLLLVRWLDVPLVHWRLAHLPMPTKRLGGSLSWWNQTLYGFRDFGQFLPIVVTMVIVWRTDRRRWFIIGAILLALTFGSIGYNSSKFLLSRYRPYTMRNDEDGLKITDTRDTWVGWSPEIEDASFRWNEDYRSFPSGHSSAAFAVATVLAWFYPHLRRTFYFLATGCAFSRYYDMMHWPGDCMAGALIGYLAAYLALRPYLWVMPIILVRRQVKRAQARARQQ